MSTSAKKNLLFVIIAAAALFIVIGIVSGNLSGLFRRADGTDNAPVEYLPVRDLEISAQNIRVIDIEWSAGEVHVTPYDGSVILFSEYAERELKSREMSVHMLSEGTLSISFQQEDPGMFSFGSAPRKRLELQVPFDLCRSLDALYIASTEADITAFGMDASIIAMTNADGSTTCSDMSATESFSASSSSGIMSLDGIETENIFITTVSGDAEISGAFDIVELDSVSGSITVQNAICPHTIEAVSISGDLTFDLPENDGFTIERTRVAGDFSCDFPLTSSGDAVKEISVHGDGSASFHINSASGDLHLRRIEN